MAQRIIPLEIRNEHVIGGGVNVGAAGAHDDVVLELRFNEMWRGLTKTAVWIDALGESHTDTLLTSNFAVDLDTYQIPVPATAMQYSGRMTLTLTGVFLKEVNGEEKEIVRAVTEAVYLRVMPSYMDAVTLDEIDPSLKDQLQAEIDAVLADVLDARAAAKDAEAWAVGQIEGVDVGIDDPRYHNNAKYYSGNADTQATNAATSAANAAASELAAAGSADAAADSADAAARSAAEAEARVDLPLKKGTETGSLIVGDVVNNTATEEYAVAEGTYTQATGVHSHAEGDSSIASGGNSHAEGQGAKATSGASHAEGNGSEASGFCAHAEGFKTVASGYYSHAEGQETIAVRLAQHVFGRYNIVDTGANDMLEIVGNGISGNNRSNARTLDEYGNEWLAGKLTMEGTPTADKDAATKKYVDDAAAALVPLVGKGVNLFDNAYFIGGGTGYGVFPVNQRGDAQYSGTSPAQPAFDRWKVSFATATLTANGVELVSSGGYGLLQFLSAGRWDLLVGKTVTLSALVTANSGDLKFYSGSTLQETRTGTGVLSATFVMPGGFQESSKFIGIQGNATISAVKLELGSQQTLARKVGNALVLNDAPPDYGQELAKCSAYLHIIKAFDARNLMIGNANANAAESVYWDMTIPIMVKTPSLTVVANKIGIGTSGFSLNPTTVSLYHYSAGHAVIGATGFSGLTLGQPYRIALMSGGTMIFSAE